MTAKGSTEKKAKNSCFRMYANQQWAAKIQLAFPLTDSPLSISKATHRSKSSSTQHMCQLGRSQQAGCPSPARTAALRAYLIHKLLHLLHGMVGLQGKGQHPHLLLLFLGRGACLLFFSLGKENKGRPIPGVIP